ncbi:MAG: YitT family protein [Clostridia bacterium]|nr:YitT family protein [Clostridia bacterium]
MKFTKKSASFLAIAAIAMLSALNYAIFIFPNNFAPAGIDGICTMIQDLTGINIGYLSLLANIPLIILAFFFLNRDFAVKSTLYVAVFSISSILLKSVVSSDFGYHTDTGSSAVLAPIAAGVIRGILYALTLYLNSCSGGTDIIAAVVKKKKPHLDLMNVIFLINLLVSFASFFVYGMRMEPVICSVLYSFITSSISSRIRAREHCAIKYEVITPEPKELCEEITKKLNRTATVVDAKGAYSGTEQKMVVCVTDRRTAPYLEEIILTVTASVVIKSVVDDNVTGVGYK